MIPALGSRPDESRPGRERSRSVLVVDEALPVRRTIVDALHKLGVADRDIREATTPAEALDAFRKEPPHVVFTELVGDYPEDGLEVVHEMLESQPDVKIVLVTAEPRDSAEVRAAIRAGAFAVIEKPLRHEKIRQVMQDLESEEGGIERLR